MIDRKLKFDESKLNSNINFKEYKSLLTQSDQHSQQGQDHK